MPPGTIPVNVTMNSEVSTFRVRSIDSKEELETYFKRDNILLHLYEIGDLDEFFWSNTSWFALENTVGDVKFIALIYGGANPPVVIALGVDAESGQKLLSGMDTKGLLPCRFYSHLSLDLSSALSNLYNCEHHGRYLKMGLLETELARSVDVSGVHQLLPTDLPLIEEFYRVHYPGNWFDSRMLETKQTFGVWSEPLDGAVGCRELLAIAGVHVYSTNYSVAALGNIAVHESHRGRGLARKVTAALVQSLLLEGIAHIGLNVLASNAAAMACYTKLGFAPVAEFEEIMWERT